MQLQFILVFIFHGKEEIDLNLNSIVISPITTLSKEQEKINLAAGLTQDIAASLTRASKKLNVIKLNNGFKIFRKNQKQI